MNECRILGMSEERGGAAVKEIRERGGQYRQLQEPVAQLGALNENRNYTE